MDKSEPSGLADRERREEERKTSKRYEGKIHSFFPQGGFGFITSLEIKQLWDSDVYFHKSAAINYDVEKSLKEGVKVSFSAEKKPKGRLPKAKEMDLVK